MKRRRFLTLLGSAVTWPLVSSAQQPERMRRVGVLMHTSADDPDGQTRLAVFLQGLQEAGWAVGRNVRVDIRWAAADVDHFRSYAAELTALGPDVVRLRARILHRCVYRKPYPHCLAERIA
jgi:putative ABC transport system substrate-binding protein